MQTKLQVATDESYQDHSNLQGKNQKHQAFEAELEANQRRMQAVIDVSDLDLVTVSVTSTQAVVMKL